MQLTSTKELSYLVSRFANSLNFKTDTVLENTVSNANRMSFERDVQKMLEFASEMRFIGEGRNKEYANECFKSVRRIFAKGTGIIRNDGTNAEFSEAIIPETRQIIDYIYLIENNEEELKQIVLNQYYEFDKNLFKPIIEKIVLNRKDSRDNFFLYDEELHGGEFLDAAKTILKSNNQVDHFHSYGIDRDVNLGLHSRNRGIQTARKDLLACSDMWVDIAFAGNDFIHFFDEEGINEHTKVAYNRLHRRKLVKKDGLMIFNIPYYRVEKFRSVLMSHQIDAVYRTDDEAGNMIIVMKKIFAKDRTNFDLLRRIMFNPGTFPTLEEVEPIYLESAEDEGPKTFRAYYIDLDDVASQFTSVPSVSDFIYSYLEPEDESEDTRRALQEPKEGHIPTLATSGIVSGRYIDEVLEPRYQRKIGFDNLIETKIVKRDIEEEQTVIHNGEKFKEISLKKSNIIVSTALTSSGEFVELFSNDTDPKDEDK